MKIPFRLMLAHARRTKTRTILTVLSVLIAILIFGILRSFVAGMEVTAAASNPKRLVVYSAISLFAHLPKRLESDIRAIPIIRDHVKYITNWTWYGGNYKDDESPEHNMWARFGVDVPSLRKVYASDMDLDDAAWDRWEASKTGCVIGEDLAKKYQFEVGSRIPIRGNIFLGRLELDVVGIYKTKNRAFDQNTLFFHWDYLNETAKAAGGRADRVSTYTLYLDDAVNPADIMVAVDSSFESSENRTLTQSERQFQEQFASMFGGVPFFFAVLGAVVLVACLMVTTNTMVLNARERVQEIGVLKTLGFTPGSIAFATLVEALLLCLIGGGIAIVIVRLLDGVNMTFFIPAVPWSTVVQGLALAAVLGLISGIIPAMIASRMNIVTAIRRRA